VVIDYEFEILRATKLQQGARDDVRPIFRVDGLAGHSIGLWQIAVCVADARATGLNWRRSRAQLENCDVLTCDLNRPNPILSDAVGAYVGAFDVNLKVWGI